jgi:NADPH-dependent glutamate synthase beta subunit-like oxidoreductase
VSLDAAATARRQGAEQVVLLYRRGEQEMRVWKAELEEARKSGVEIRFFAQPVEILGENSVSGMLCRQTRLGDTTDATGRRVPVEIPGSDFRLEADAVIVAIGQVPAARFIDTLERTAGGYVRVDGTYQTSLPGVFAGGDVIGGEGTVVQAVGQGKAAAKSMIQHLDREL